MHRPPSRADVFQTLRPACIQLSQSTLRPLSTQADHDALVLALTRLLDLLKHLSTQFGLLDDKLTDYTFFPLSHLFRHTATLRQAELDLAVQCLNVLIARGWSGWSTPSLAPQLLILLVYLVDAPAASATTRKPLGDELQEHVFASIGSLFHRAAASSQSRKALVAADHVPALGHAVSVLLDVTKTGAALNVHTNALAALQCFCSSIADRDMLKAFLPGIVSTMTLLLTPTTQKRQPARILIASLNLLKTALQLVLADRHRPANTVPSSAPEASEDSWLAATASQVKMALANVMKLRQHEREDVRLALANLCQMILEDCQASLRVCLPLVLESAIVLRAREPPTDASYLSDLVALNPVVAEVFKSAVYNKLISAPTHMLSNDDAKKHGVLEELGSSLTLLVSADCEFSFLADTISTFLQETLSNAIYVHPKKANVSEINTLVDYTDTALVLNNPDSLQMAQFQPVLTQQKHAMEVVNRVHNLLDTLGSWNDFRDLATTYLDIARSSRGDTQVINFWLALNIVKIVNASTKDFDDLIDAGDAGTGVGVLRDHVYSYALEVLSQSVDETAADWRLHALALEAVAFEAAQTRADFRPELADILYPIVHLAGSRVPGLREHALTCLNLLADSCGFLDAKDLLVSNVDYLVNAVGIKINTFDIAPQAPQVLTMMIKLCGPTLLPFLDDVVDGMFDAIECFHGYTKLTTLLFSVLGAIVDEGIKVSPLKLPDAKAPDHRRQPYQPATIASVIAMLKPAPTPTLDNTADLPAETPPDDTPPNPESTPAPLPTTPTYALLHRIAHQTQHHLPSSSPALRASLLRLLYTALPHLAAHDDAFLPLVHTLWPVLLPRLADAEAYVVAAVLDVLAAICAGAGDFVAQRVEEALWPAVLRLHESLERGDAGAAPAPATARRLRAAPPTARLGVSRDILALAPAAPALTPSRPSSVIVVAAPVDPQKQQQHQQHYTPTTNLLIRASLTRLVVSLLAHVRVSETVYAEALGRVLRDELVGERRQDVREALEVRGGDAVWLVLERRRARAEAVRGGGGRWARRPRDVEGAPGFVGFV